MQNTAIKGNIYFEIQHPILTCNLMLVCFLFFNGITTFVDYSKPKHPSRRTVGDLECQARDGHETQKLVLLDWLNPTKPDVLNTNPPEDQQYVRQWPGRPGSYQRLKKW